MKVLAALLASLALRPFRRSGSPRFFSAAPWPPGGFVSALRRGGEAAAARSRLRTSGIGPFYRHSSLIGFRLRRAPLLFALCARPGCSISRASRARTARTSERAGGRPRLDRRGARRLGLRRDDRLRLDRVGRDRRRADASARRLAADRGVLFGGRRQPPRARATHARRVSHESLGAFCRDGALPDSPQALVPGTQRSDYAVDPEELVARPPRCRGLWRPPTIEYDRSSLRGYGEVIPQDRRPLTLTVSSAGAPGGPPRFLYGIRKDPSCP